MTFAVPAGADDKFWEAASVAPEGELTIYTVASWKETLLAELERGPALCIDLRAVAELDTAGMQLLLLANREAQRTGKALALVAPSEAVTQVLELCNVSSQFELRLAP